MEKLKIGITGGIGCGQSSVVKLLQDNHGAPVVSMDQAGRDAVEEHLEVRRQLRRAFGDSFFDADGNLHRARLAQLIFSDPAQRQKLNDIVHPVMLQIVWEELAAAM
ncbi:dephospho-CoA kinase, partial [candidate division KSB1 bacterium]|nr:dephospho-CoA kinase [candidate division KSB1 bacterium]